ncbi:hypothetical protein SADUNF_Sadunf02G0034800 [Salix dunnii]|uniref:C2H2-type domain-containing protein n=1 Tax=Salix dunnii TaxID=1413687 RepID=A0A835N5U0_9ROSI|nr:hypothetical protein SADUNF_Sadunf02G0034800 [Salix dunnii]
MDRNYQQRSGRVKDKWERNNVIFEGEHSTRISWPQRNYTCSFCKREFSSAQALGGHMNVHRRDRARLKQLPSWFFECPKPTSKSNPKPLPHSSSKFSPYPDHTHDRSFLSPFLTSFSSPSYPENKSIVECPQSINSTRKISDMRSAVVGVGELKKNSVQEVEQTSENISLDLEMRCEDPTQVLDLELRLGCS